MGGCRKAVTVIGCFGVMIGAVGCANKNVVKKDAPVIKESAATKPVTRPVPISTVQKKDDLKKPVAAASAVTPTSSQPTKK